MSNALGRDLAKLVAAVDAAASECGHGAYGQRFHIMPPAGWLNDPNGLCQAGGVFHAYFSMRRLMSRAALRSGAMRRVAIL